MCTVGFFASVMPRGMNGNREMIFECHSLNNKHLVSNCELAIYCNQNMSIDEGFLSCTQSGQPNSFCHKCNKGCTGLDHAKSMKDASD
jgi:hypothetical protein